MKITIESLKAPEPFTDHDYPCAMSGRGCENRVIIRHGLCSGCHQKYWGMCLPSGWALERINNE